MSREASCLGFKPQATTVYANPACLMSGCRASLITSFDCLFSQLHGKGGVVVKSRSHTHPRKNGRKRAKLNSSGTTFICFDWE